MKLGNWNTNASKVKAWAEAQEESDSLKMILMTIGMGDNAPTDEMRSTYWTAIRSIGSTLEGFPQARKGRESGLTDTQESVIVTQLQLLENAFAQISTEGQELMLQLVVPHGRTGGVYGSYDELVANYTSKAKTYILSSMKEGRVVVDKDNEFVLDDNNRLQITPRPTKGDTNEEVSEEE